MIDKTTWCGVHLLKSHMNHFVQTTKLEVRLGAYKNSDLDFYLQTFNVGVWGYPLSMSHKFDIFAKTIHSAQVLIQLLNTTGEMVCHLGPFPTSTSREK